MPNIGSISDGELGSSVRTKLNSAITNVNQNRETLTANRIYYVRTDGSDSNDGLTDSSGGAFLTIQKAIDVVATLDLSIYNATIQIADGTYTGVNALKSLVGAGKCIIQGNTSTPANVLINTTATCFDGDYFAGRYELKGMELRSSAGSAIFIRGPQSIVEISSLNFGACAGVHLPIYYGAQCFIIGSYTISGNAAYHFNPQSTGMIIATTVSSMVCTISGSRTFTAFIRADRHGQFVCTTAALTFSTNVATGVRYQSDKLSIIDTNGAGTTYFPGNSTSSPTNGAIYT